MKFILYSFLGFISVFAGGHVDSVRKVIEYVSEKRAEVDGVMVGKTNAYKVAMADSAGIPIPEYRTIEELAFAVFRREGLEARPVKMEGLSGNKFFEILDESHHVLGLVKVFSARKCYEFLDEVYSLDAFNKRGIPSPKLLGVGKVDTSFAMVQEVIAGDTLNDSIQALKKSENREESLKEIGKRMRAFGSMMAKFHETSEHGVTDPYVRDHFTEVVEGCVDELCGASREICIAYGLEDGAKFVASLDGYLRAHKPLWEKSVPRTYVHADCNFGNFIYDQHGKVRMLDTWWGAFSVDREQKPRGVPFLDIVQVHHRFEYLVVEEAITREECDHLQSAFEGGYEEAGGVLPNDEERDFYAFIDAALLLRGVTHNYEYVGECLGHLVRYWIGELEGILAKEEELAVAVD